MTGWSHMWVDDAVVQRVINHQPPGRRLTIAERSELVEYFFHKGFSARQSSERIGCAQRSVVRVLKRLGLRETDRTNHPRCWNG